MALDKYNGKKITSLKHLYAVVSDALNDEIITQHRFEFDNIDSACMVRVILDKEHCNKTEKEVFKKNLIAERAQLDNF